MSASVRRVYLSPGARHRTSQRSVSVRPQTKTELTRHSGQYLLVQPLILPVPLVGDHRPSSMLEGSFEGRIGKSGVFLGFLASVIFRMRVEERGKEVKGRSAIWTGE